MLLNLDAVHLQLDGIVIQTLAIIATASGVGFTVFSVYPAAMDACFVGDEKARPQPGGFYGGWITDAIIGPFKGDPGTMFW